MRRPRDTAIPLERFAPPRTLGIVFQFGKVASTSLVAALNKIENMDAKQSHFLGYNALSEALRNFSKPDVSDYFFNHQFGQFCENTLLTRRLTAIQTGISHERLLVISVVREPLSWFRSVILQDISGNIARLRNFIGQPHQAEMSDSEVIEIGLTKLLDVFANILERNQGIDEIVRKLPSDAKSVFESSEIENQIDGKILFYTMLRPFNWLQKHFEPVLQVRVSNMTSTNGILRHTDDCGDYFILKYESIETDFSHCLKELGYGNAISFDRLNISSLKSYSLEVRRAFATQEASKLLPHFCDSAYSRQYGYDNIDAFREWKFG